MSVDVAKVIEELGGHPRSDDSENVELLANEVIILREKLKAAVEAEGREARHTGKEADARVAAERRAEAAEAVLSNIETVIANGKVKATAAGVPLRNVA